MKEYIDNSAAPHNLDMKQELAQEFTTLRRSVSRYIKESAENQADLVEVYQYWFSSRFWKYMEPTLEEAVKDPQHRSEDFCQQWEEKVENLLSFIRHALDANQVDQLTVEHQADIHFAQLENIFFDTASLREHFEPRILTIFNGANA